MHRRAHFGATCVLVASLAPHPTALAELSRAAPAPSASTPGDTHTVRPNETLSAIAARYGMSLDRLLEHNPDVDPDQIQPGQEITLGEEHRVVRYTVRSGDTLGALAQRFGVAIDDIVRSHPGLRPDALRVGQTLHIRAALPASYSRSIGRPSRGRLENPRRLPRHRGWVIRDRERAWGTDETIADLVEAFDALGAEHPRAPRIEVHDVSLRNGGPMNDHKSHESGRDVDLALYHERCTRGVCGFRRTSPAQLDAERQWALLRHLIARGRVEAIFLDYRLQRPLYEHARAEGASDAELHRWFQYPHGPGSPLGIIRHFRKHDDHLHVRFACHASDTDCESLRPLLTRHASR